MYTLIEISNRILAGSAFDHAGHHLRKTGLAVAINEMLKRRSVAGRLRRGFASVFLSLLASWASGEWCARRANSSA